VSKSAEADLIAIDQLAGLWRRTLLALPDGSEDTTTEVRWLQGPGLYADLRQPANRPSFAGVRRLRDLDRRQIDWLARQEGFAGRLVEAGDCVEWLRDIDFQPPSLVADAGRLRFEGGVMVEEGRDVPYLEHWTRPDGPARSSAALALRSAEAGEKAMLVVADDRFMFARARPNALPRGLRLGDLAAAASLEAAQDMLDCEIAFGPVGGGAFTIAASSLPFREGVPLGLRRIDAETIATTDLGPGGEIIERVWRVVARESAGDGQGLIP